MLIQKIIALVFFLLFSLNLCASQITLEQSRIGTKLEKLRSSQYDMEVTWGVGSSPTLQSSEHAFLSTYSNANNDKRPNLEKRGSIVTGNWHFVNKLGFYHLSENLYPWCYFQKLGWVYLSESHFFGFWFWKDELGWLWSTDDAFPFVYSVNSSSWLYVRFLNGKNYYYNYETSSWFN